MESRAIAKEISNGESRFGAAVASPVASFPLEASRLGVAESDEQTLSQTGLLGDSTSRYSSPGPTIQPHLDNTSVSKIEERLRPIARKPRLRAITKNTARDHTPMHCRVDLIRAAQSRL